MRTLFINNTEFYFMSLTYTDTHPKEHPDRFDATLRGYCPDINFGDEVVIKKSNITVWKGIIEDKSIEFSGKLGFITVVGGRDKSVLVWRKYNNKYEIEE